MKWEKMNCMEPDWYRSVPIAFELYMTWDETEWLVFKDQWWENLDRLEEFIVGRAATLDEAMVLAERLYRQ